MALDRRYYLFFSFEQYFVDKDTGLPLANGYIKFFRDSARSTPKDVYILTGSPPSYTYLNIGDTVNLTGYGVPVYSNNNVALYAFPFEGDPSDNSAIQDLYYYEVYSEADVLQFTREGQPNVFEESTTESVNNNYVPNGQFLWHNDIPADVANEYMEGKVTQNSTVLAQGGWSFDRPTISNVVDVVTFERILSPNASLPTDNPRYRVRLNTQDVGAGGAYKDLRLKFDSVNKFQSYDIPPQQYTYTFSAENNDITTIENVEVRLIKNYGTGGDPFTDINIGTFDISPTATQRSITFDFGNSAGKSLGNSDDDYLQLVIRMPGDEGFDVSFTDFGLFAGNFTSSGLFVGTFTATTDNQFTYKALAGSISLPDYAETNVTQPLNPLKVQNANLYLPVVFKPTGLDFDRSIIGKKEEYTKYKATDWDADQVHVSTNLVMPWGQQFETADYSPLGIPWSRLQAEYWDITLNLPLHGTGLQFMTATIPAANNVLLVSNNSEGAVTNASDGTATTGFTFATIHKETTAYFMNSFLFLEGGNEFVIKNKNVGAVSNSITNGTTAFTVAVPQTGTAQLREISSVVPTTIADNPGNPGKYWTIDSISNAPANLSWYIWYQVSTETDPAPGGTGIKVNLIAGDTAAIVAQKTWQAMNGFQETTITTVAASSLVGGDFFNIYAFPSQQYVVWYEVNSIGTQPVVVGTPIFIKVVLAGTETAAQVATATQKAMNMKYFAVPDYRGMFFRSWDHNTGIDPGIRYSYVPGVTDNVMGTFELDMFKEHHHSYPLGGAAGGAGAGGGANEPTSDDGGAEERPVNAVVNVAIRY